MNETGFGLIMLGMTLWFVAVVWWSPRASAILTGVGAVAVAVGVVLFHASLTRRPHQ